MMKKRIGAGAAILGLALAACGNSGTSGTSSNPQLQNAEKIVQDCVNKGNVLTSAGRDAILNCIAPAGHRSAFVSCAQGQLAHADLFTNAGRNAFIQALTTCLEQNR